jgi:hypothetical protein
MTLKAGVILTNFDTTKVLVVVNKDCVDSGIVKYGLPKGHREEKETVVACAMRELREETGLMVRISKADPKVVVSETTYFLIKASRMFNPRPQDLKEIGECGWVTWDEIMKNDCNRGLRLIKRKLEVDGGSLTKRLEALKPRAIGIIRKKNDIKQKEETNEEDMGTSTSICEPECSPSTAESDDSSVDVP